MAEKGPTTVAIVDDDDDVRRALFRLLSAMGFEVQVFPSAEDFEAESGAVDCAIVDVRLPGLSGLDLRERLRNRMVPTPVVLITGGGDRLTRDLGGAVDAPVVTKPFDAAELATAIFTAISSTETGGERHAH
jgi:FixJ family two-component response regulator